MGASGSCPTAWRLADDRRRAPAPPPAACLTAGPCHNDGPRATLARDLSKATQGLSSVAKQRNRGKPTRRRDKKGGPGSGRRKPCPYCKEKIEQADYKDTATLRKFISEKGKIRSRRITGACRRHQSQIARAVKRARELALLPYVNEGGRDDADRERGGRRGRDDR
jgi:small subunit ribosomal protein S18